MWALMMNFIMFYYTDIFGITAAAAGTIMLFARSSDGIVDFFIGAIADRTTSKWGRFRPYLVWFSLPLAETRFASGCVVLHDTKNGAAAPAKAVVRRNWRRDQVDGAERSVLSLPGRDETLRSFMSAE